MVTQASWVRSLMASFVKAWEPRRTPIGGLFGANMGEHETVLPWTRPEQAAFIILFGNLLYEEVSHMKEPWMAALRAQTVSENWADSDDLAFFGPNNLLNSDPGIRVLLQTANDFCFMNADFLELHLWGGSHYDAASDLEEMDNSLVSLGERTSIAGHLRDLSTHLAAYDWRSSRAPGLTDQERTNKAAFRGSGGYRELRRDVLRQLATSEGIIAASANQIMAILGY